MLSGWRCPRPMESYPKEEQRCDKNNGINGLSECEFGGIGSSRVARSERILLEDRHLDLVHEDVVRTKAGSEGRMGPGQQYVIRQMVQTGHNHLIIAISRALAPSRLK